MKYPEETYNSRLDTPGRTFFFDVKKRYGESKRLVVTQSRVHDGAHERERVTVYEEDISAFVAALMKAIESMAEAAAPRVGRSSSGTPKAPVSYAEIRKQFPKAYMPWTQEEDEELVELEIGGMRIPELAERFQRKPGAIRSRIRKLAKA